MASLLGKSQKPSESFRSFSMLEFLTCCTVPGEQSDDELDSTARPSYVPFSNGQMPEIIQSPNTQKPTLHGTDAVTTERKLPDKLGNSTHPPMENPSNRKYCAAEMREAPVHKEDQVRSADHPLMTNENVPECERTEKVEGIRVPKKVQMEDGDHPLKSFTSVPECERIEEYKRRDYSDAILTDNFTSTGTLVNLQMSNLKNETISFENIRSENYFNKDLIKEGISNENFPECERTEEHKRRADKDVILTSQ